MNNARLNNEFDNRTLPFSCVLVAAVFFLVLSQAIIIRFPPVFTQVFRPAIVFFLLIRMVQRGQLEFPARRTALIAAIYCILVLLLNPINSDEIMSGLTTSLYLLMFVAVTGIAWNKRESSFIVEAVFWGTFVCAVAVMLSNDITNLHTGVDGDIYIFGVPMNRNKNAYAFAIGVVLGIVFMARNRGLKRLLFTLMTGMMGFCLMYSQCRGAFLCTSLGIFTLIGVELLKLRRRNSAKAFMYAILVVISCIVAYYLIKNSQFSRLIDGESTSGRDIGIKHAWQLFLNSDLFGKIFGNGFGYEEAHSDTIGAHLVYATFLVSSGLVGCMLIILMFVKTFARIKGAVPYALFAVALSRTFFEGLDYYIYIPLILSVISYNYMRLSGRTAYELFEK